MMQSLLRRFDPRLEAIAVPMFWPDPDQHDPSRLDEQGAQIAIAAFRYLAKDGAITGRGLFRDKAQPSSEVAAFRERIAGADCGHHRAGDDGPDTRYTHQSLAAVVTARKNLDLARQTFDARIEPTPVTGQVLDDAQHAR